MNPTLKRMDILKAFDFIDITSNSWNDLHGKFKDARQGFEMEMARLF